MGVLVQVYIENFLCSAKTIHKSGELSAFVQTVDFESNRQMAILNATTMQRDRVNLGRSAPVQKCQQIFEIIAARHMSTLHYCPSSGLVSQPFQSPQMP